MGDAGTHVPHFCKYCYFPWLLSIWSLGAITQYKNHWGGGGNFPIRGVRKKNRIFLFIYQYIKRGLKTIGMLNISLFPLVEESFLYFKDKLQTNVKKPTKIKPEIS